MKRPDRITIISVYHFVVAGLLLLGACAMLAVPFIVSIAARGDPDAEVAIPIVAIVMAIAIFFVLALAVAHGVVGWGLWALKPWARIGSIVLAALGLVNVPVGTIIGLLILWYLFQPEARTAFEAGAPPVS